MKHNIFDEAELEARIAELEARIAELEARIAELEAANQAYRNVEISLREDIEKHIKQRNILQEVVRGLEEDLEDMASYTTYNILKQEKIEVDVVLTKTRIEMGKLKEEIQQLRQKITDDDARNTMKEQFHAQGDEHMVLLESLVSDLDGETCFKPKGKTTCQQS